MFWVLYFALALVLVCVRCTQNLASYWVYRFATIISKNSWEQPPAPSTQEMTSGKHITQMNCHILRKLSAERGNKRSSHSFMLAKYMTRK